jgi:hypothetical protein
MKTMFRILVALLLVGGWALAASALHVIVSPGHITVVPKNRLGMRETYVDARSWTIGDVATHPLSVNRLIATHNADVLMHVIKASSYEDLVSQLMAAIEHPPTTQPASRPVIQFTT